MIRSENRQSAKCKFRHGHKSCRASAYASQGKLILIECAIFDQLCSATEHTGDPPDAESRVTATQRQRHIPCTRAIDPIGPPDTIL